MIKVEIIPGEITRFTAALNHDFLNKKPTRTISFPGFSQGFP
jgi:hypothetical protein